MRRFFLCIVMSIPCVLSPGYIKAEKCSDVQGDSLHLDFESGSLDWEKEWELINGADSCRDYFRIDRLRGGYLIREHQSYYSDRPVNYLLGQLEHIVRPWAEKGFWDQQNGNWIRQINWSEDEGWNSVHPHDWKYSLELQEGALVASRVVCSPILDQRMAGELVYIHSRIGFDGQVEDLVLPDNSYEYGLVMSVLGLGSVYFKNRVGFPISTGSDAKEDLKKVYKYITATYEFPEKPSSNTGILLRGMINAMKAFEAYGETVIASGILERSRMLAASLCRAQNADGSLDLFDARFQVQGQLKADIALLMMFMLADENERYIDVAGKNLDWIVANRIDRLCGKAGALLWYDDDRDTFFECHQMWFLIAARYFEICSGEDLSDLKAEAIGFLTDDNFAGVDMYMDNLQRYGAFFSYRAISRDGSIQKDEWHKFKGAYEIGASLWAMALNLDLFHPGYSHMVTAVQYDRRDPICFGENILLCSYDFGHHPMRVEWDFKFNDVTLGGGYTGLFADRSGNWKMLVDSGSGIRYMNDRGHEVFLCGNDIFESGRYHRITAEFRSAEDVEICLSRGGIELMSWSVRDMSGLGGCHLGIIQVPAVDGNKNCVCIDEIKYVRLPRTGRGLHLGNNFPNPFNAQTTVYFDLDESMSCAVSIYDIKGRLVRSMHEGYLGAGRHFLSWDGKTERGLDAASGVYFLKLEAGDDEITEKLVIIK